MFQDTSPIRSEKPDVLHKTLNRIEELLPERLRPKRGFLLSFKNRILISTLIVLTGGVIIIAGTLQFLIFPQLGDSEIVFSLKVIHLLASLVVIALSWLFVEIISKKITSPLLELTKRAEEISREAGKDISEDCYRGYDYVDLWGEDDLDGRGDEIRQLTSSFNRMLVHLKASEACLRESESKYRFLFHHMPSPLFVIDAEEMTILDMNARAEQEYRYSRMELIGKNFSELAAPLDRHDFEVILNLITHTDTDEPAAFETKGKHALPRKLTFRAIPHGAGNRPPVFQHQRKDGSSFLVNIQARLSTFRDRPAIIAAVWDVTEKLQQEAKLLQAGKMATLGEMSTGVAHELNQPLNVIKIAADFLMKNIRRGLQLTPEELKQTAEELGTNVDRAVRIISHLREFGRKVDEQTRPMSLAKPIRGVFTLLGSQLSKRGIRCDVLLDPKLPLIMGNENRLEQVFINLIVNARDAMMEHERAARAEGKTVEKTLTVKGFEKDGRVVVEVTDTGPGVPRELREKVFEPFYTSKAIGDGTGIGLSISYGIIKEHRGAIEVLGEENRGATFRLTFPALKPSQEIENDQDTGNR